METASTAAQKTHGHRDQLPRQLHQSGSRRIAHLLHHPPQHHLVAPDELHRRMCDVRAAQLSLLATAISASTTAARSAASQALSTSRPDG
ncbi:hypothetical protein [Saccharopolyspora hattusasensis]|uniref:hypothetical protein n=1 Tax=Saccharopolyspora hattusasensis TaxID=1128679 RepID=UPI003D97E4B1